MADEKQEDAPESPEVHFEPLVQLVPVDVKTLEEEEKELLKLRARLFRFDNTEEPPEWKERGTGDVKILQHKDTKHCRILMRRDKTLKVCANHKVMPDIELKAKVDNEKAWLWTTYADFADGEYAQKFKEKFEEAQKLMKDVLEKDAEAKEEKSSEKEADNVVEKLSELKVEESGDAAKTAASKGDADPEDNGAER